ncbi:response regulator transcription factor [Acidobacteria bacterium AH-259-L09]|nr:response regulator transcription factor [Acidobacteria bacterium AH-259-L09]
MSTVLIIEDEPGLVNGLRDAFEHQGFEVVWASDGKAGLELALSRQPDIIILDLMLPKKDGMEVCRELRARNIHTPVIMLTARSEEPDRVAGLEIGADDYVTKPFSVRELIARTKAVLRRSTQQGVGEQVRVGESMVDFKQYAVFRGTRRFSLTDREVVLLRFLIEHPHEVVPRESLLDEIWGYNCYPTTRTVDTFIYRLRQKIEADPQRPVHLLTVHGVGYKFVP